MKCSLSLSTFLWMVCLHWSLIKAHSLQAGSHWQKEEGFQFREIPSSVIHHGSGREVGWTLLSAEEAGVRFQNLLSDEDIVRNQNFMNGSGLAAGDYDGDGWCDLYFCSITGSNALYRNLGNGRFADVTKDAGVAMDGLASTGAVLVDVNHDGQLDLLVATLGQGVHSWINQGNGIFRETTAEAGLQSEFGSTSMALGDVDGDGDLDLYVTNYGEIPIVNSGGSAKLKRVNGQWVVTGPFAKRLRVVNGKLEELGEPDVLYLNDGTGGFEAVSWQSDRFLDANGQRLEEPWEFGLGVQMRDVDLDGDLDIYVCNDFQSPDRFWLNQGDGHFRAIPPLAMRKQSYASMGVDFADLDRDGFLDFFVVEMLARDHFGRMTQVAGLRPEIPYPARILNRPEVARNTLFKNLGDGTYAEVANFAGLSATDWSWQPVFLDVDLDGFEDVLVVNGMPYDTQDRDTLEAIRSGGKQSVEQSRSNVLRYPDRKATNMAFRNTGDWRFEDQSEDWGFHHPGITHGVVLADLDNDGDQDVITNNLNESPHIYRNDTIASRVAVRLQGSVRNTQGIGALVEVSAPGRLKQMRQMMAGGRYLGGDAALLTFACGETESPVTLRVAWPGGKVSVVKNARANREYLILEDAGRADTASRDASPQKVPVFKDVSDRIHHTHQEELFHDFTRQPMLPRLESQQGPGVAWCDLDDDGSEELVVGAGRGGMVSVWQCDVEGKILQIAPENPWTAPDDTLGMTAWSWQDGSSSVLFAVSQHERGNRSGTAVKELSLNQDGLFAIKDVKEVATVVSSPGALAGADFDLDGDLDLFVGGRCIPGRYPLPADSRLFRQEGGKLVEHDAAQMLLQGVGMVQGAVWSDLNRDGAPELVVACEWGAIRIFHNNKGVLAAWNPDVIWGGEGGGLRKPLSDWTGWWRGISAGDFDEDGRMDLVVANWGLNDGYATSFQHPLELYFGDFSGSGRTDLMETMFSAELNAQVPVRNFNELRQNVPVFQSFGSHRNFSHATVSDLLAQLPQATRKVGAAVLHSVILLNRGTHFEMIPLPNEAQWAPAFSVHVADIDNDGHEDVFLSQNFFATRPLWPRLDAGSGLWLKGDGTGRLKALLPVQSGVRVYGEQRGAAVADFNGDGKVDFVVSQNAAETRMHQNQTDRPGLRVRLHGPGGNPRGFGAIIRLETDLGMGPAREVHAGSGYGSQDGAIHVLGFSGTPTRLHVFWPGGVHSVVDLNSNQLTVEASYPDK